MKRERRQPTRREWEQITSRRPVVRKIQPQTPKPESEEERLDGIAIEQLNAYLEAEDDHRR